MKNRLKGFEQKFKSIRKKTRTINTGFSKLKMGENNMRRLLKSNNKSSRLY